MTKNKQILAKMGGSSLALLLSLSLGQQASAVTLVQNLTQTSGFEPSLKPDQWVRSSFTTGSSIYGYTLDSVTLLFREINQTNDLFVSLYGDNAGSLDGQITSFDNPVSITPNLANNTFTLTTPQTLAANTTYWLVAGILGGGGSGEYYRWASTDSANQTGEPGWSIGNNSLFSSNQGFNWNSFVDFKAFQFSVNGTQNPPPTNIPEPGSVVALLGLGGLGLASTLKKLSTRA